MAYKITVEKTGNHPSGNILSEILYAQTAEKIDLPAIILAVNKGSIVETMKSWFGDLIPKK